MMLSENSEASASASPQRTHPAAQHHAALEPQIFPLNLVPVPKINALVAQPLTDLQVASHFASYRMAAAAEGSEGPRAHTTYPSITPNASRRGSRDSIRSDVATTPNLNHMVVNPEVLPNSVLEAQEDVRGAWCAVDYMLQMDWTRMGKLMAASTEEVGIPPIA